MQKTPTNQAEEQQMIEEFLTRLNKIGWFDQLPNETYLEAKRATKVIYLHEQPNKPLVLLPGAYLDPECVSEGIHKQIIKNFSDNSLGLFNTQAIEETWEETKEGMIIKVTIKAKDKEYSQQWLSESMWVEDTFDKLLKEAVEDTQPYLTTEKVIFSENYIGYITCNKSAYKKALEEGLFAAEHYPQHHLIEQATDSLLAIFADKTSTLRLYAATLLEYLYQKVSLTPKDIQILKNALKDQNPLIQETADYILEEYDY